MLGYVFAACKESPSPMTMMNGRYFKLHRGMGSQSARQKRMAVDRYSSKDIPEGTEVWIPFKGEVSSVVNEFVAGIRAAMGYAGASNIGELRRNSGIARVVSAREKAGMGQRIDQIR
jgi:IMP dehydrogenase